MAAAATDGIRPNPSPGDSGSDEYGPDFDTDEEQILSGLLQAAAEANTASTNGTPSGAKRRWSERLAYRPRPASGYAGGGITLEYESAGEPKGYVMYNNLEVERDTSAPLPDAGPGFGDPDERELDALCGTMELDGGEDVSVGGQRAQPRYARGDRPGELSPPPPENPDRAPNVNSRGNGARPSATRRREAPASDAPASTSRPPIERFRPGGRPLSVTDLVSPAWCEMQWAFILARHGRKPVSKAMASGTRIHQQLEAEVHTTVSVDVASKEESFGLRVWNVIQSLRTLRSTGQTREMEVWGIFDGQLVNGVIDELSYTYPDRDQGRKEEARGTIPPPQSEAAIGQSQVTDFFNPISQSDSQTSQSIGSKSYRPTPALSQDSDAQASPARPTRSLRPLRSIHPVSPRVYICDVKTRRSAGIPKGALFRPTFLQLMLYRYLLGQMIEDTVSVVELCHALRLDPDATFSDAFVAQVGGMGEHFYDAAPEVGKSTDPRSTTQVGILTTPQAFSPREAVPSASKEIEDVDLDDTDRLDLLLSHNSIGRLWSILHAELQRTFPDGEMSLSDLLRAEYRSPEDGKIRGTNTFAYERERIETFVSSVLQWWRGEREPVGVVVEEAHKCAKCDFAGDCEWRKDRESEAREKTRHMNKDRL